LDGEEPRKAAEDEDENCGAEEEGCRLNKLGTAGNEG
jgi:hypothetical protein